MSIALITQVRYHSKRLPGKVLKEVNGKTLLSFHLENAKRATKVDDFIVATTEEPESNLIKKEAFNYGWIAYQGSTNDVLGRFYKSVEHIEPKYVVRITSDCPLIQPALIDSLIQMTIDNDADYSRLSIEFPDGVDVEVFTFDLLKGAHELATNPFEREHVTPWIRAKAKRPIELKPFTNQYKNIRITVDEFADFECLITLVNKFGYKDHWYNYCQFISDNGQLFANQSIIRNEGSLISDEEKRTRQIRNHYK
jgi:spore coat polysaccharide biosynthesis protein SpsF